MKADITAMGYSLVSPNLDESDRWHESVGGDISHNLELFERYIQQVVIKKDITHVTRGNFVNPDTNPQSWMETVRTTDYTTYQSQFTNASDNLARELNSQIHPRANRGVLFCVQATVSEEPLLDDADHEIVALLKLDLREEQRIRLADDRGLEELDLEDIFPEPNELQKGLIYPIVQAEGYRLPGDVKFYQESAVSDYFHDFLECDVEEGSLEQAKDIFEIVSEIKREHTGESADGDDTNKFRELRDRTDTGIVGIDDVVNVATEIVGREVTADEIADWLDVDNPENLAIDTENLPSTVKYEIDRQISIRFPSTAEDRVQKEEGQDEVEVRITGTDLDTEILDS